MTNQVPQLSNRIIQYLPPRGVFEVFRDDEHYKQMLKEWGLSAAKEAKKEFWYKEKDTQQLVTIKGYEIYGTSAEFNTVVIEFDDGQLTCIHPAYLKEMQQASFGKESMWQEVKEGSHAEQDLGNTTAESVQEIPVEPLKDKPKKADAKKLKKEKIAKIELPIEKVHFTASVKQLAMTYNPFTEENDEVVILENVQIHDEPLITLEYAWCSHSKTLKKWELVQGDSLEFDGKITAKKLPKGKDVPDEYSLDVTVQYKINNPSKIVKHE